MGLNKIEIFNKKFLSIFPKNWNFGAKNKSRREKFFSEKTLKKKVKKVTDN